MKVVETPIEGCKIKLSVQATAEEVNDAIEQGTAALLSRVRCKPMEEGEDPIEALKARFGELSASKALSDAVIDYLLPEVLRIADVVPVCSSKPISPTTPEKDKDYEFAVEVYKRPQMELSSYEPVSITIQQFEVTEKDIDNQLLFIARMATRMQDDPVTGQPRLVTPAITDTWVAEEFPNDEVNSVAELREQLRNMLEMDLGVEMDSIKMNTATSEMAKRLEGEIPQEIVDIMRDDLIANFENELLEQGKALEVELKEQNVAREQFDEAMEKQARDVLAQGLTMDAIFRNRQLELSDEDIEQTIRAIASSSPEEERETIAIGLRRMGRTPAILEVAQRMKAGNWILETAEITIVEPEQPEESA